MLKNKPNIKEFCDRLRKVLVQDRKSINDLQGELSVWTADNLRNLYDYIINNPIEGEDQSFNQKLLKQIEGLGNSSKENSDGKIKEYLTLMLEVMSIYYAYPASSSISEETKKRNIKFLLESDLSKRVGLSNSKFETSFNAFKDEGIGGAGMGFNTNRYSEIMYLLKTFSLWFKKPKKLEDGSEVKDFLNQKDIGEFKFQQFLDSEEVSDGKMPQCRHLLLFFLFPDYYQPIISSGHKNRIIKVFKKYLDHTKPNPNELTVTLDQSIRVIANKLSEKVGNKDNIFYDKAVEFFWNFQGADAIQGFDLDALIYKKQIVLYGPPGTSKTYTALQVAKDIISYEVSKSQGINILEESGRKGLEDALENNIHRLQLHQAYTYEDFIGGLQFVGGDTLFQKGYLLNLIEKMQENPVVPHVLILDEINRVDLSRLFGECFSALENRGEAIDLLAMVEGKHIQLTIPNNLYIIGTMNLIDHSVEQLDFALRRRFLWVEANYNPDALLEICAQNWKKLNWERKPYVWEGKLENDFNRLIEAADALNSAIEKHEELGPDFKLGHVFFIDAVKFLHQELDDYVSKSTFLFTPKGDWRSPIEKLWNLSLSPLLSEYLSGLDHKAKQDIMKNLKTAFSPKPIK